MKRLLSILALLPTWIHAAEHTVTPGPFTASVSFDATFLPKEVASFSIDPKVWTEFKILDIKDHGALVKKDEAVGTLDVEGIDRRIADDASAAALRKMALATAEGELKDLEQSTAWKLETAEMAFARLKFDLAYFKETGRPLAEEQAAHGLDRARRALEYAQEELKQLLQMYAEDDLTEETEEIILKRQRASVDAAEFAVKQAEIGFDWTMKQDLPRKAVDLEQAFLDAQLAYNTAKLTLPRALEQKRLEVEKLQVADARAAQAETDVLADRKIMDLKSPAAGRLYHGEIADGRWSPASAAKFMKEGGIIPPKTIFAALVPENTPLKLHAFVEEAMVLQLKAGQTGQVAPTAAPRRRLAVTLESVAPCPDAEGKYHVVLGTGPLPEDLPLVTGMKGAVKLITFQKDEAIVIPAKTLEEAPDGSLLVRIKLADGASEKRPVTVGRESEGNIEVLTGLEAGQVVLVPGEDVK